MHHISENHQTTVAALQRLLDTHPKVVIISHPNPDGDSIGSSLALQNVLRKKGLSVECLVPNHSPGFLSWLPGISELVIIDKNHEYARKVVDDAGLIICVDFNSFSRLKEYHRVFDNHQAKTLLIDHHLEPDRSYDLMFHTHEVSSTSELVYNLLQMLAFGDAIDFDVAVNLYVGIMTDTGSFSYSCNYISTYVVTAELMKHGIDAQQVHNLIYDNFPESRMRLLGHLLRNCMVVKPEFRTAYMFLTLADQKAYNFQVGDAEGIVNYALSIEGIRFAAFFTEKHDKVRLSFRSKGNFSVNLFARTHFEGGGHKNAAGASYFKKLDETIAFFESLLPEYQSLLCAEESSVL